jgi:S-adenosylmethionine decarboxylase
MLNNVYRLLNCLLQFVFSHLALNEQCGRCVIPHKRIFNVRTSRFGWHLTLDGYGGEPGRLGALEVVRAWLDELPDALGMDKLIAPCLIEVGARNEKDPGGITGFVLIAQSHLSVHTFPRRGFVRADVFTCQEHLDHEGIRRSLITTFRLGDVESNLIPRGTRYPLVNLDDPGSTGAPG